MLAIDWLSLALGVALIVVALWLAIRFAESEREQIHYVYTVLLGLGAGFLGAFIPGTIGVGGGVAGLTIRAGGGLAVFALVIVIFYLLRTKKAVARARAASHPELPSERSLAMPDCNSSTTNCNDDPITVCTSLPEAGSSTAFDTQCRELAEMMCMAVVRYMEEYNRTRRNDPSPAIPAKLDEWMKWARNDTTTPGLPDCLDLTTTSTAANFTKRTYNAVRLFRTQLIGFDIDDWHDE